MGMKRAWAVALGAMLAFSSTWADRAAAADEPYYMAEVGATVHLPPTWTMSRWSDWDFRAEANDRSMMMWLFYTPWQVEPTDESVQAWAQAHVERLKEMKAGDIKVSKAVLAQTPHGTSARIEVTFHFNGDGPLGVYYAYVFPGDGKNIHIAALSGARHDPRTRAILEQLVKDLEMVKKPEPLARLTAPLEAKTGYRIEMPKGWRIPAASEVKDVAVLAEKTGHKEVDPEKCVQIIRPVAKGDPDYALFCSMVWYLDPVDSYSWTGVGDLVHKKLFGNSPTAVPAPEKLELPDRLGFFFIPTAGGSAVRMIVVPYDRGIVVGWGLGQKDRETALDAGFREVVKAVSFTGPENGKQKAGFGQWLGYYLKYRKTSPVVLAPLVLVLGALGLLVFKMARKKPAPVHYP